MMWGLKGFKEQRSNVSFYLSNNFFITMRVHKLHKTLLEAASASIAKSREKMKISYALSSSPWSVLASSVLAVELLTRPNSLVVLTSKMAA